MALALKEIVVRRHHNSTTMFKNYFKTAWRNLMRNKGFSFINHIPSGDDDLFINKTATRNNTAVVIDPEAITLSVPKKTLGGWLRQKSRHYTTALYYKPKHKFLLGLYFTTQFAFYPLFAISAIFYNWQLTLTLFGFRFLLQAFIFYRAMKKMNESDLWPWFIFLDMWMFFYYIIFAPALWRKPRTSW